jgi:hypothetical protein
METKKILAYVFNELFSLLCHPARWKEKSPQSSRARASMRESEKKGIFRREFSSFSSVSEDDDDDDDDGAIGGGREKRRESH